MGTSQTASSPAATASQSPRPPAPSPTSATPSHPASTAAPSVRRSSPVYALGADVKTDGTRSDLESDFLALCQRAELPAPEVNVRIGRWTVDFLWSAQKLAVETDSYRYHHGTVAFEDDRARDLALRRRDYQVLRFTERQLEEEPSTVIADLKDALRRRR